MAWEKLGLTYQVPGNIWWAKSHAIMPTPFQIDADRLRIYYCSTDKNTVGRIGFVETLVSDPTNVFSVSDVPVFDIGNVGSFDDNGVAPSSILRIDDQIWLYYVGFQLGNSVPYTMFSGLAVSDDGGLSFHRNSERPVLGPIENEEYVRTAPYVVKEDNLWRIWYVGGNKFIDVEDNLKPTYSIRYLESRDGINWPGPSQEVLALEGDDEFGFGRPRILFDRGVYTMFYSIRTKSVGYRMGLAKSTDGLHWNRVDNKAGIVPGPEEWDNQTVEYGMLVEQGDELLMFYNGNQYGRTGFGAAKSVKSDWHF
jgi:predicted GH43/DUF377 family glycosyl hydrolase